MRELVAERGWQHRVTFDVVDRAALAARYAAADAFVFASEWDEPFGLTPVEAMACGVPVLGTATGGSGEFLVDGWNCLWFSPGDPRAMAAAVDRLAEDEPLRRDLVANGFATAAQLDTDVLASTFHRWHRAVADRFRSGRPPDRVLEVGPS